MENKRDLDTQTMRQLVPNMTTMVRDETAFKLRKILFETNLNLHLSRIKPDPFVTLANDIALYCKHSLDLNIVSHPKTFREKAT